MRPEDLEIAIDHGSESDSVDYKRDFDSSSSAAWPELVKDIIVMANSGGGAIIIGVSDSGEIFGCNMSVLGKLDPADLTNKIFKYTGQQFNHFSFRALLKDNLPLFAILVQKVPVPIVFSKPGTYDIGEGKQKTAFSAGTVYFRHGAKSEPCNSDDLRYFLEQRIEEMRKSWFEGIVKVVEAPAGASIQVVAPREAVEPAAVHLVNDPKAPAFRSVPVDETHPYRQKELVMEFNKAHAGVKAINPYHIKCVRQAHGIDQNPTFCYKMRHASAQFSKAFLDWILEQYSVNPDFFELAKALAEEVRRIAATANN